MEAVRRIGIFLDFWDLGEISSFCFHLGNGLQEHGYDVVLILGNRAKPRDIHAWREMLAEKKFRGVDLQLSKVLKPLQSDFLYQEVLRLKLDILILNRFPTIQLPVWNTLAAKVRIISIGHSDHSRDYTLFCATQYFAHRHVAISKEILTACTALCPPAWRYKLTLCHYGLEALASQPPYVSEGPMRVVYSGPFDFADSRLQDLPPLWKSFLAQGGYGRLTLIGDGDVRTWLKRQFATETEIGTVRFLESQRGAVLAETLAHEEIVISTANWDGLGLIPLKAILLGCYPVLSDTRSGHREIIQELGGGIVCPVGDIEAFTQVLLRCASIRAGLLFEREKLRAAAQDKFGLIRMVENYHTLIQATMAEPMAEPAEHLGKPPMRKPSLWDDVLHRPPRPIAL